MDLPSEPDRTAIRLAERLIQLLGRGGFTATYKYAVLVALMDLCMELTSVTGLPPDMITTRQLAEKVIEIYWPHCAPYGSELRELQDGRCFYCEKAMAAACHVDHFVPWSRPDEASSPRRQDRKNAPHLPVTSDTVLPAAPGRGHHATTPGRNQKAWVTRSKPSKKHPSAPSAC